MNGLKDSTQHQVVKATTNPNVKGIRIDGKDMNFGDKARAFTVEDPGLAREIEARFGRHGSEVPGTCVTVPIRNAHREPGHTYVFTVPEMPWKKEKPNGQEE